MSVSHISFILSNIINVGFSSYIVSKYINSEWYRDLKTPTWTPQSSLRSAIWIVIIFTFGMFMSLSYMSDHHTELFISIFLTVWFLEISWNLAFFKYHKKRIGLIVKVGQLICISAQFILSINHLYIKSILILPFLFWIIFSCAFNVYLIIKN